ncbi:hypothetical protein [Mangrovicella endophytica]|uniref:hypothetical protein n=1 Tax=Mangrovicella endophytica TaxID=2066697 RepID=UPI0012FFF39F|nr:hypothetical protein [Mangrovicella endophytica]
MTGDRGRRDRTEFRGKEFVYNHRLSVPLRPLTSGSGFHHTKLPLPTLLKALRTSILRSKGNATSTLMKDIGIHYRTAFLLQQKFGDGLKHCIDDITLEGEVEINGGWFGGYIKPEKIAAERGTVMSMIHFFVGAQALRTASAHA